MEDQLLLLGLHEGMFYKETRPSPPPLAHRATEILVARGKSARGKLRRTHGAPGVSRAAGTWARAISTPLW